MTTIQIPKYSFKVPPQISERDYEALKGLLNEKPYFKLNPPSGFVETFKFELTVFMIGAIGAVIILVVTSLDVPQWLILIGGIPVFFAFMIFISFLLSMFSYLDFLSDKKRYYTRLKQDIVNSNNYKEFYNLREVRRKSLSAY